MKYLKKVRYNSPVILTYSFVALVVLIVGIITDRWLIFRFFSVYRSSPLDPLTYVRLFTYVLGHIDFNHYMSNMLLMLIVGPPLEEKYGSKKLLIAIAITAFVGGVVQITFFPNTSLLGASGIVFMMIVLSSFAGMEKGSIPLTLIIVIILYLGQEILQGITIRDNISQFTHIIGGICGVFIGFAYSKSSNYRK